MRFQELRREIAFVVLGAVVPFFGGCAATSPEGAGWDDRFQHSPKIQIDEQLERKSKGLHYFLMGELSYLGEDFENALRYYERASTLLDDSASSLHARLAVLYVRSSQLERAEEQIRKALEQEPKNVSYRMLYAGVLESLGRPEEAMPIYEELIREEPERLDPYLLLSEQHVKQGHPEKAVELLQRLVKLDESDPAAHYYLARAFEAAGKYQPAERHMRRAYELKDNNQALAGDLMRILLKANDGAKVKRFSEELLKEDPKHPLARRILGELAIGEGNLEDAIGHLQALDDSKGDATDARFRIALIQIERQNFAEAERELLLVLAKHPEHSAARYYLASIYAGAGRTKEAVDELSRIEPGQEMYARARTFAAFLLRQEGETEAAEQAAREAYQAEPDNMKSLGYLVSILREAEKYDRAEALLEQELAEHPDSDAVLFQLGIVQHESGREKEAIETMERVIALNPDHAEALNFVAYSIAEEQEPDLDRALELVQRALAVRPDDGYFLDTLGWIYYRQGEYEKAEPVLSRAVAEAGDDMIISEHYGDVLRALNQLEKAIGMYRRVLQQAELLEQLTPEEETVKERVTGKLRELRADESDSHNRSRAKQ